MTPVFASRIRLVGSAASTVTQATACRRCRQATNRNATDSAASTTALPATPITLNRVVASTTSGKATIAAASAWKIALELCPRRACAIAQAQPDQRVGERERDADGYREHARLGHRAQEEPAGEHQEESTDQRDYDDRVVRVPPGKASRRRLRARSARSTLSLRRRRRMPGPRAWLPARPHVAAATRTAARSCSVEDSRRAIRSSTPPPPGRAAFRFG